MQSILSFSLFYSSSISFSFSCFFSVAIRSLSLWKFEVHIERDASIDSGISNDFFPLTRFLISANATTVGPESRKHIGTIKCGNETLSDAPRCTKMQSINRNYQLLIAEA